MYSIQGKVIVMTGANGGMGKALCRMLADEGAKLAISGRNGAAIEELAAQLPASTLATMVDVRNEEQVSAFFARVRDTFGGADALVNLAGLSIPGQISETSEEDFDMMMDVNVKGTFFSSKHFAPIANQDAQIINVGSMAAFRANGNAPLYCTSKAAVNMLGQAMAIQYAPKGIRVANVNPAGTDTPFWGSRPVAREKLLKAEDVAELLLFILKAAPYMVFSQVNFESFNNMAK